MPINLQLYISGMELDKGVFMTASSSNPSVKL